MPLSLVYLITFTNLDFVSFMAYQKYICVISEEWVPLLTRLIALLQNLPKQSYFQNKDNLIMGIKFYSNIHPLIILINVIY